MENKNNKGLTLIEVLVSITLTSMIMLYTTSFFSVSWRLGTEQKEYSMILDDVRNNLESYKARKYGEPVSTSYVVQRRILRSKYDVIYSLILTELFVGEKYGVSYIESKAEWSYGGDSSSSNIISIKSACCKENLD